MKASFVFLLSLCSISALAEVGTLCGVRSGTAGNVYLENSSGEIVATLGIQGGRQRLAEQADSFIRGGMQNGHSYCVNYVVNRRGVLTDIVGAYPNDGKIQTICGVRAGTAGNASLEAGNDGVLLAVQGGYQRGLTLIDKFIRGGTQVGKTYCVNGTVSRDGFLISAVGAFRYR